MVRCLTTRAYLTVLEVVQKNVQSLALNTVFFDHDATASHDLSRVTLTIDLAQTSPSAKDFGVTNFNEVDLVLSTERLDEFDVLRLCAGLDKHAQMGLTFIKRLCALTETSSETVMNKSVF
jgi:hypothetical protein